METGFRPACRAATSATASETMPRMPDHDNTRNAFPLRSRVALTHLAAQYVRQVAGGKDPGDTHDDHGDAYQQTVESVIADVRFERFDDRRQLQPDEQKRVRVQYENEHAPDGADRAPRESESIKSFRTPAEQYSRRHGGEHARDVELSSAGRYEANGASRNTTLVINASSVTSSRDVAKDAF